MAIRLKQLETDPSLVRNPNAEPLPEWVNPLGKNPNPTEAGRLEFDRSETNPNKLQEMVHGKTTNNVTKQNQQNADNGMVGGVLPVTGVGTDGPIQFGNQYNLSNAMQDIQRENEEKAEKSKQAAKFTPLVTPKTAASPASEAPEPKEPSTPEAAEGYVDINVLTDRLLEQQEAERAKFERKRMADRLSRMGFALGNLVGAKGGKTDASAITLDDGSKQVGEYRKDMEDINKQNMDAYQRALNLIYHKEEQDYKNAVLEENKRNHEATLSATKEWRDAQAALNQSKLDEAIRKAMATEEENKRHHEEQEKTANARVAKTGSGKGSSLAEYELVEENVYDKNGKKTGTKKVRRRIGSDSKKTNPMNSGGTTTGSNGKKTITGF